MLRERERERERDTDRQTERQTNRQERERDKEIYVEKKHSHGEIEWRQTKQGR